MKPVVLLVSGEYPPYTALGGNAYQFHHLARMLRNRGFQVEVIAESPNADEFTHQDDLGHLVHRISGQKSVLFKGLKRIPRFGRPFHHLGSLAYPARVLEKVLEIEHVFRRRILWIETSNYRAETVFVQMLPSLNRRTLVRIVTPMEEVVRQNEGNRADRNVRAGLWAEQLQQLLLRHRLYSNEDYKAYFADKVRTRWGPFPVRDSDRTFLLPFDFARVVQKPFAPPASKDGPFRLLMVGRVEGRKGFDVLCRALTAIPAAERRHVRIVAVGRDAKLGPLGSYKALLNQKYPEIFESHFEWRGQVSDAELKDVFSEADGGLVASTSESFGYNLVELVASDLPVIASDVGVASELERRGIRYLGKFKSVEELTGIFKTLPDRFTEYLSEKPHNRIRLQQMYAENDSDYFRFVDEWFAPLGHDALEAVVG